MMFRRFIVLLAACFVLSTLTVPAYAAPVVASAGWNQVGFQGFSYTLGGFSGASGARVSLHRNKMLKAVGSSRALVGSPVGFVSNTGPAGGLYRFDVRSGVSKKNRKHVGVRYTVAEFNPSGSLVRSSDYGSFKAKRGFGTHSFKYKTLAAGSSLRLVFFFYGSGKVTGFVDWVKVSKEQQVAPGPQYAFMGGSVKPRFRWCKQYPISVYIDPGVVGSGSDRTRFAGLLQTALGRWSSVSGYVFKYRGLKTGSSKNGLVSWGGVPFGSMVFAFHGGVAGDGNYFNEFMKYPGHQRGFASFFRMMGYVDVPSSINIMVQGHAALDGRMLTGMSDSTVILEFMHATGHMLGLADVSSNFEIMSKTGSHTASLGAGDVAGVRELVNTPCALTDGLEEDFLP